MRLPLTLFAAVLAFVAMIGCTAQQSRDTALAAAHLVALQDQYAHAAEIYHRHVDDVPEPRRAEVERAWAVVELLYERLQANDIPALVEALALFELARPAWQQLHDEAAQLIASGAIADPLDQLRLVEIDRRARRLDEAVQRLVDGQQAGAGGLAALVADLAPLVALVARAAL